MRTDELVGRLEKYNVVAACLGGAEAPPTREAAAEIRRLSGLVEEAAANFAPIFAHLDNPPSAPGHAHQIQGVWDDDVSNGERAGNPCDWCAQWERARATLAKLEHKGEN